MGKAIKVTCQECGARLNDESARVGRDGMVYCDRVCELGEDDDDTDDTDDTDDEDLEEACSECGTDLDDDDETCPGCGAELIDDDAEE